MRTIIQFNLETFVGNDETEYLSFYSFLFPVDLKVGDNIWLPSFIQWLEPGEFDEINNEGDDINEFKEKLILNDGEYKVKMVFYDYEKKINEDATESEEYFLRKKYSLTNRWPFEN